MYFSDRWTNATLVSMGLVGVNCENDGIMIKRKNSKGVRERCIEKKVKKKLTSVSFAFTHTYTPEKLTLLLFSPSVHGKF